jgi:hypothetical protein
MANEFLDAIAAGAAGGEPLVWLEAEEYGSRVINNGKPLPWTNPTEFVSKYSQLLNLLKPGAAPVHIGSFLAAWLEANSGVLSEMGGKSRLRYAIRKLLGMEAPRLIIRDIVSALCQSVSQPVMLVFPENGRLVNWANRRANNVPDAGISDIDVDTVSVYLADFMRAFSGLDVAGVLVQLPAGTAVNPGLLELYSPLVNVAKHYHWAFGIKVMNPQEINDSEEQLNFIISDHPGASGKVLGESFWQSGECEPAGEGFYYAAVPAQMEPELVLDRLAGLRNP